MTTQIISDHLTASIDAYGVDRHVYVTLRAHEYEEKYGNYAVMDSFAKVSLRGNDIAERLILFIVAGEKTGSLNALAVDIAETLVECSVECFCSGEVHNPSGDMVEIPKINSPDTLILFKVHDHTIKSSPKKIVNFNRSSKDDADSADKDLKSAT